MHPIPYKLKCLASLLQRFPLLFMGILCSLKTISATQERIPLIPENIAMLVNENLLTREEANAFMCHQEYVASIDSLECLVFLPYWREETIERIRSKVYLPHRKREKKTKRKTSYIKIGPNQSPLTGLALAKQSLKLTYKEEEADEHILMLYVDKSPQDKFTDAYARFSLMLGKKFFGEKAWIEQAMLGKYNIKIGHGLIIAGASCDQKKATEFFTRPQHKLLKPCGSKIHNNGLTGMGLQGVQGPYKWVILVSNKDYYTSLKGKGKGFSSIPKNNDAYHKQSAQPIHEELVGSALHRKFSQGELGITMLYHNYDLPYGYESLFKKTAMSSMAKRYGNQHHVYVGGFGKSQQGPHELTGSIALSGNKSWAMVVGDKIVFNKKKKSYMAMIAEHYAPYFYNLHGNKKTNEQNVMASIGHCIHGHPISADLRCHRLIKPSLQTRRQKNSLQATVHTKTTLLPIGFQTHSITVGQTTSYNNKRSNKVAYKTAQEMQYRSFNFKTTFGCSTDLCKAFATYQGKLAQWIVYQQNKLKITLKAFLTYAYGAKESKKQPVKKIKDLSMPAWHLSLGMIYELCAGIRLHLDLIWDWNTNKKGELKDFWASAEGLKLSWQLFCDF